MKNRILTVCALVAVACLISLAGWARQERMLRIHRGNEVIQEYNVKDFDYIEIEEILLPDFGEINGHEYVDLGLPSGVKWATCNVDATTPYEAGNIFAWGETYVKPGSQFTESGSKTYGKSMKDISGNPEYDTATAKWGGTWRMPTNEERLELMKHCTWQQITKNDIKGFEAVGPNGNRIFFPTPFPDEKTQILYWTSTPHANTMAFVIVFDHAGYVDTGGSLRYKGAYVRPVSY